LEMSETKGLILRAAEKRWM